jgi:hypothetical protein
VGKKRRELWNIKLWILHQDSAPTYNTVTLNKFLANRCILVLERPSYLLDLAPCNFCLFPKVESALKVPHFQCVDEVKLKNSDLLNRVSAVALQHCFEQWKIHMQWCIGGGECTLKAIEINL